MLSNLLQTLYLNLAAGYLKLKQKNDTIAACEEALKLDPKNTKALFRKAKACILSVNSTVEDYKQSLACLKVAHENEPNDQELNDEIMRITREYFKLKNANSDSLDTSTVDSIPVMRAPQTSN